MAVYESLEKDNFTKKKYMGHTCWSSENEKKMGWIGRGGWGLGWGFHSLASM